jgi:hypothetical protein
MRLLVAVLRLSITADELDGRDGTVVPESRRAFVGCLNGFIAL